MKNINGPLRTTLEEGQAYVDEPVFKNVPVYCAKEPVMHPELRHYKRIPLRWMKPGTNGKLVPR